jgi:predicted nucleic acid-binding protein
MIFLQPAARPNGPAAVRFEFAESGHIELFVSDEIIDEVVDVLSRPTIRKKFPILPDVVVHDFLERI